MLETWRWFGPDDAITLSKIRQAGASGIVTALSEVPTGEIWPEALIKARLDMIKAAGLQWSVVESVPLHNDIKTRSGDYQRFISNYKDSLANLGKNGIYTVCYNFMPVVDWTRTNLSYTLPNSSQALRFEMTDFVAYDVFILERPGAESDYTTLQLERAEERFRAMNEAERELLEKNIIAGLPGGEGCYDRQGIKQAIQQFTAIGTEGYRQNLFLFLLRMELVLIC